jgi:hypothetical protein
MKYEDWLNYKSNLDKRDVSKDEEDYDLKGYFDSLKSTSSDPDNNHLPDEFKKPNHPTFSNESKYSVPVVRQGGQWTEEKKFIPSEHNLKNMSGPALQDYFNREEKPENLDIPDKMSGARRAALEKLSR